MVSVAFKYILQPTAMTFVLFYPDIAGVLLESALCTALLPILLIWLPTVDPDSPMFCILWNLTPRWTAFCGIWLHGVLHTVESDSAINCLLWYLTHWYPAYCKLWLTDILPIVKSDSPISCLYCEIWLQNVLSSAYCGIWLHGVLPTVESDSAVSCLLYCEIWLRGVLPTLKSHSLISESDFLVSCLLKNLQRCVLPIYVKSDTAVSCLLWNLTPRCSAYCEIWLHGVLPAE